jgi:two-component system, NtrC family, sensor kinase
MEKGSKNKGTFLLGLMNIRRLVIYLLEKYYPFKIGSFQITVVIVTALLLGVVLILGWMSGQKVREVVTEDFNQQQLVLARHTAQQIENSLAILKEQILLLSLSPSIQYFEKVWIGKRIGITFSGIKEFGALEIRYVESEKKTHIVNSKGLRTAITYPECKEYLKWGRQIENKNSLLISKIMPSFYHNNKQALIIKMVKPVWQVSVDETNPQATNKFSGVLVFIIDTSTFVGKITESIRSGKTGYAWVIDENGTFLYHIEKEFIGKNAFEARKEKRPMISFARINEIQREKMLKGEEGTSWYLSGWHKGKEGQIKKLIAYSPISLDETGKHLWSVAVVAPISEVENAIQSIQARQISLQAIIIIWILFGGLTISFMLITWSGSLEQEVSRKTAELQQSEQRYKSLIENAEDIIFTVDKDGNYLSINNYGARFFNMKPDDIIGRNMSEIISMPDTDLLLMTVREVFDRKKGKQITHLIRIGENKYWFNTNLRRLLNKEGNIYAILGISRDITSRKIIEEQSFNTEKLASMGTLSAGVAHEINNPLAIILGFTDLLLEKTPRESQDYDMLKTIEKHGLRAKLVVENLLSFARCTERKEELLDINKNIEAVFSVIGNTLLMNRINIKKELQEDLPFVDGCAEELQQVFFNIITNAVSAMGPNGTLTITTQASSDEKIEIRFADTGPGIPKEHRRKIFDPLFTTKKIGEGTGLGLSVSYGIIVKHGGTIDFETKTKDESEETGTTFIITLPTIRKEDDEKFLTDTDAKH